jgi:NAD(P)-binding Rossmann-like domain
MLAMNICCIGLILILLLTNYSISATESNATTTAAADVKVVVEKDVDICFIGAGPSGIQAAYTAEKNGYTVAVFEKDDHIGGKTKTVIDPYGFRYRMGAALLINGGYPGGYPFSLKPLLNKFNIPYQPLNYTQRWYDLKTQAPVKYTTPPMDFWQSVRYLVFRTSLSKYIDNANSLTMGKYPKLLNTMSAEAWIRLKRFTTIMDAVWMSHIAYGYGLLKAIPAIYFVKYTFTSEQYVDEESKLLMLYFQDLLLAMAKTLRGKIYLNAKIQRVKYNNNQHNRRIYINFYHKPSNQNKSILCGSTVIAFPQLTKRMTKFMPNTIGTIGKQLKAITDQIQTTRYASALFDDSKRGRYYHRNMTTAFVSKPFHHSYTDENVLYARFYTERNSSIVAYSYAKDFTISSGQLLNNMFESYKRFMNDSTLILNNKTVYAFYDWDYFPHVNSTSLNNGFYSKFDKLQGKANQYYTGGLFNFETVQNTMAHGKYIINRFFPPM